MIIVNLLLLLAGVLIFLPKHDLQNGILLRGAGFQEFWKSLGYLHANREILKRKPVYVYSSGSLLYLIYLCNIDFYTCMKIANTVYNEKKGSYLDDIVKTFIVRVVDFYESKNKSLDRILDKFNIITTDTHTCSCIILKPENIEQLIEFIGYSCFIPGFSNTLDNTPRYIDGIFSIYQTKNYSCPIKSLSIYEIIKCPPWKIISPEKAKALYVTSF